MIEGHINLYSDTQSRPSLAMREAMLNAPMGDEQKGLDESVNALCATVAELLGMEAAVFLPSGTMCNEIALLVHCKPADEVYADRSAHILNFEAGGPAAFAGVNIYALNGTSGVFTGDDLAQAVRKDNRYAPLSRLVSIEQTANLGGGKIWSLDAIRSVTDVAKAHNLICHMDGARLMNAVVASGVSAADYCAPFDSAWIDLSKGLGCPFGGVLAGSQAFIDDAWRWKQRMGGAMRQAGMMAAAGLYALEHHLDQLALDHKNARRLAEIVGAHEQIALSAEDIDTNIVLIDIAETGVAAASVVAALEQQGINVGAFSDTLLRAVTHIDVTADHIEEAGQALLYVLNKLAA